MLGLAMFVISVGFAGSALADPAPLTDRELDAISASGFAYPSFGAGRIQPTITTVVPFVPTSAAAKTEVDNLNIAIANTTNVVTAINQCILSHCSDTSADVTASPTTENNIDIKNEIVPNVQNTTMVPINIGLPNYGGGAAGPALGNSALPQPSFTSGGIQKLAPPLPQHGFGGR